MRIHKINAIGARTDISIRKSGWFLNITTKVIIVIINAEGMKAILIRMHGIV